jgi:uncharacterized membrane protein YfhO
MEIALLDSIDTKREAVVDARFEGALQGIDIMPDSTATISLTDYKVNHLTYEYSSSVVNVAVFSEIYYDKGWTAYIDGEQAPYFRADYVLRGMVLPAGDHTVEFRFRAPHFTAISGVTLVCSLIILIGCAAAGAVIFVRRRKNIRNS